MSDPTSFQSDLAALNELIVNCPDFERLEALLGGFNLFRVLDFEHGEIRHSNVLAWILDPNESHGLDDQFLQKWLMRVVHESADPDTAKICPVDIDAWQLVHAEVRREWQNIDLLLVLTFSENRRWVVCIENKILSGQHSNQLRRYRERVEQEFPTAQHQLFLFLTKSNEVPEDDHFIPTSYTQVHHTLKQCLRSRTHAIGPEPKVLLENYVRLLEETFMDESEIARTALRIYQQHRRALDVIFEHRPDNLLMATERVRKLLAANAERLGILMESCSKAFVRFIPRAWDHPGNTHGNAWSGSIRTVLFDLNLAGKTPYLYISSGKAPDAWIDPLWMRSAEPPFRRSKRAKTRPPKWCMLHNTTQNKISLDHETLADPDEIAQRIYEWCVESFRTPQTQEVVTLIAAELPRLHELHVAAKA